jgi:hypothetical protein
MPRNFLSDEMWCKLAPPLPPERGKTGRPYMAHRPWIEAILWKPMFGMKRDLPALKPTPLSLRAIVSGLPTAPSVRSS